jgi:hypothetical protein
MRGRRRLPVEGDPLAAAALVDRLRRFAPDPSSVACGDPFSREGRRGERLRGETT